MTRNVVFQSMDQGDLKQKKAVPLLLEISIAYIQKMKLKLKLSFQNIELKMLSK